jgi:tetratricopeptide (TPR) repeat protein
MKKTLLITLTLFLNLNVDAQSPELNSLSKHFNKRNYNAVIEKGIIYLKEKPDDLEINSLVGRSLQLSGKFQESLVYLNKAIQTDNPKSYSKAWALNSLAVSYFALGKYELVKDYLDESIQMNATNNSVKNAKGIANLLGCSNYYDSWIKYENENFRYYFQDTVWMKEFIARREPVYDSICRFFNVKMENKITYIVWSSREEEKKILNSSIGFAKPELKIIHSQKNQSLGHEMTHVISHYSYPEMVKTGLINEGIAVYLDFNKKDAKQEITKAMDELDMKRISIKDFWNNWRKFSYKISYPLAGEFVGEIIETYGKEKFLVFFSDQTYKNAKLVFGNDFDDFIKEFESKYNGRK